MKVRVPFCAAALGAVVAASLGCGGEVVVQPAPAKPVVVVRAEPAPAPAKKTVLLGLPLSGSQIDVLGEIEFDVDKATIRQTPKTIGILTTMANAGRVYPQITRLRVEGHTDSDGNEAHNQELSEQRAREVVRWLVEHGVEARRLIAVGCGSRDPLVPNTTSENKQRNRRTEFDIEEVDGTGFEFHTPPCGVNPARKR